MKSAFEVRLLANQFTPPLIAQLARHLTPNFQMVGNPDLIQKRGSRRLEHWRQ